MMEVREILERGRGRIADEANWSKTGPGAEREDGTCDYCVVSSMWPDIRGSKINENIGAYDAAVSKIGDVLGIAPERYESGVAVKIGMWNDTPGRTHAEVLDVMSRAIDEATSATTEE